MSEALAAFIAETGEAIGKRAAQVFADEIRSKLMVPPPDPILSCAQAGKRMGVSGTSVSRLIDNGYLPRVPGFIDRRVKQSDVDNYGKSTGQIRMVAER